MIYSSSKENITFTHFSDCCAEFVLFLNQIDTDFSISRDSENNSDTLNQISEC